MTELSGGKPGPTRVGQGGGDDDDDDLMKGYESLASLVPAACLLALCYVGCARGAAVALTALGVTCIGGMFCGFLSNHIDIAPNFAGKSKLQIALLLLM